RHPAACGPGVDDEVGPRGVAKGEQTFAERGLVWSPCGSVKKSDPVPLPCRLLCLDGERRGAEADADARDECPPLHHWMTSSARSRSDCGIVSPRALAVLRLITNSNFSGRSIGNSAGFAPFRIFATKTPDRRKDSRRLGP